MSQASAVILNLEVSEHLVSPLSSNLSGNEPITHDYFHISLKYPSCFCTGNLDKRGKDVGGSVPGWIPGCRWGGAGGKAAAAQARQKLRWPGSWADCRPVCALPLVWWPVLLGQDPKGESVSLEALCVLLCSVTVLQSAPLNLCVYHVIDINHLQGLIKCKHFHKKGSKTLFMITTQILAESRKDNYATARSLREAAWVIYILIIEYRFPN